MMLTLNKNENLINTGTLLFLRTVVLNKMLTMTYCKRYQENRDLLYKE